ncbi:hypothetical protein [Salinispora mooreana]|uniref:hypothetical protein n=1 Tax=Salinispora mooreana TaxID=999545 RepID=UPI00036A5781|nr:hypothetical protein [Salinispora mooreana]
MCVQSFFTWSRAGLRPAAASAPDRACGLAAGHVPAHAAWLDQDSTGPILRLLLAGGEHATQRVINELDRIAR